MKLALVIFTLLLASWQVEGRATRSSGEPKNLSPEGEACVTELNLNRGKIVAVNWFVDVLPEGDTDFVQFMGCLSKRLGLMKSDGTMDFDKIKQTFLRETESGPGFLKLYDQIVTDSVESCQRNSLKGLTQGHTALKTLNCVALNIMETVKHN